MTETEPSPGALKTWIIAARPFAYTASVLPVLLGLALSCYTDHPVRWGLFALTLLGVVVFHTATNLLNDCFDFRRGLDKEVTPVSGAVVRGLLTPVQAFTGAGVLLLIGVAVGLYLVHETGRVVLLLGMIGFGIAVAYTTAGLCLKFMALGDLAVFLAFGPLPVFGTYWVQAQEFSWLPIAWSVPLVLLTVGILHANNWRDIERDPSMGCHTVASLLGDRGSDVYYRCLTLGPFVLTIAYYVAGLLVPQMHAPVSVLIVLLGLPLSLKLVANSRARHSADDPMPFVALDGQTAKTHTAFGVLLVIGFFVGRHLSEAGGP